ncbi:MAG: phosphopantetheine-binding protein [Opitutales bacterium]|nr:phosphopantetheine-binding protein [Opitutales bacterium]
MSTENTVYEILTKLTGKGRSEISGDTELTAGLGIDSPMALQLLFELEEALEIEISDEDAAEMETVDDILKKVSA